MKYFLILIFLLVAVIIALFSALWLKKDDAWIEESAEEYINRQAEEFGINGLDVDLTPWSEENENQECE